MCQEPFGGFYTDILFNTCKISQSRENYTHFINEDIETQKGLEISQTHTVAIKYQNLDFAPEDWCRERSCSYHCKSQPQSVRLNHRAISWDFTSCMQMLPTPPVSNCFYLRSFLPKLFRICRRKKKNERNRGKNILKLTLAPTPKIKPTLIINLCQHSPNNT